MPHTHSIRVSNTVEFFPVNCNAPKLDPINATNLVLNELKEILQDYPKGQPHNGRQFEFLQSLTNIQELLGVPTSKGEAREKRESNHM